MTNPTVIGPYIRSISESTRSLLNLGFFSKRRKCNPVGIFEVDLMLFDLGLFMVRWKWAVILFWVVVLAISSPGVPKVISQLKAGFGEADTEAQRGLDLLAEKLDASEAVINLVFSHETLTASDHIYRQAVEQTLAVIADLPEIEQVITVYSSGNSTFVSDDGHTSYSTVVLKGKMSDGMDVYPGLRTQLKVPDGFLLQVTGPVAIFSNLVTSAEEDLRRSEAVSFPLLIVALTLVFGTLVAVSLTIAMAAMTITITMGLVYLLTQVTDVGVFVLNIATFLGIGIAVDYTLLVVNRFREELLVRNHKEAVAATMTTAGRAIIFSGLTTVVGLSGLLFIPFDFFRSLGYGGVIVVLVSMLVVLSLVPAILGVLGHRVNSLKIFRSNRVPSMTWKRLAYGVMRHPVKVAIPVMVFLVLFSLPFLGVKLGSPWATVLPPDDEARLGQELLDKELGPGALSPILVVIQADNEVLDRETVGAIYDFTHRLTGDDRVVRVDSIVTIDPSITREQYQEIYAAPKNMLPEAIQIVLPSMVAEDITLLRVYTSTTPGSDDAEALVRKIRSQTVGTGISMIVTGATAAMDDSVSLMYSYFPMVIIYIVIVTYIVLLFFFRSVVLPFKAVIMNAMSILATFGALVYIFQQGHFENVLGFEAVGQIEATIPISLFCIAFGLSMDYEVFLLSRIKEEYDKTGDNTNSVALGLEKTGRIITSAAVLLVLVAGAFATSEIVVVKAFGVGIAIAVLVDATIVRALLVPALMRILGDVNWWAPRFLLRFLPNQNMSH